MILIVRAFSAEAKSIRPQLPVGPKFSGGGFNMTAPRTIIPSSLNNDKTEKDDFSDGKSVTGLQGKEVTSVHTGNGQVVEIPAPPMDQASTSAEPIVI